MPDYISPTETPAVSGGMGFSIFVRIFRTVHSSNFQRSILPSPSGRNIIPPSVKNETTMAAIFPAAIALKVDPDAPAEDDPYADPRFQVPDDLVW